MKMSAIAAVIPCTAGARVAHLGVEKRWVRHDLATRSGEAARGAPGARVCAGAGGVFAKLICFWWLHAQLFRRVIAGFAQFGDRLIQLGALFGKDIQLSGGVFDPLAHLGL